MKTQKDIWRIDGWFFFGLLTGGIIGTVTSFWVYFSAPGVIELTTQLNKCEMLVKDYINNQ